MNTLPAGWKQRESPQSADNEMKNIIEEIDSLIGMTKIKSELYQLITLGRLIAVRRNLDIPVEKVSLHLVFTGPPGTGKTVMARKIGKLFKAVGLLSKGHCVEVDRSKLVGSHLGEAGQLVREAFKDALDGVLFIDEAYSLAGGAGPLPSGDHYGNEAIQTLLKLMEDYRDRIVVIVAGYTGPMRRFLENNVGLKSRFSREFEFPSYTDEELVQIFQAMIKDGGYILQPEGLTQAKRFIATLDRNRDDFGNARDVRSFFERILPAQAVRFADVDINSLTKAELLTVTAQDIELAASR